jgi:GNAT superfamily N-acetyltransferase
MIDKATDRLVASGKITISPLMIGTLFVESKHIHHAGLSGHIEDIVVSPSMRGKGIGQILVSGLKELASNVGCYKTILDCQEAKVPFYEKCGYVMD